MEELLNTSIQTIKDAQQAANLTQDELAKQSGIATRYIMAIENENKQPSMRVLFKIILILKSNIQTRKNNTSSTLSTCAMNGICR